MKALTILRFSCFCPQATFQIGNHNLQFILERVNPMIRERPIEKHKIGHNLAIYGKAGL